MSDGLLACLGYNCERKLTCYSNSDEAKKAKMRNGEISRLLKQYRKEERNRLKILLLGTGESGKSTIAKQMKIIHINGFSFLDRMEKIPDIRNNIKESLIVLLGTMTHLNIPFSDADLVRSQDYILQHASQPDFHLSTEFIEHAEKVWNDTGVTECFRRLQEHSVQLLDSAKYFLDKLHEVKSPAYVPSDQDILRCRTLTTSIQHIEFECREGGSNIRFSLYDVGGQQGERKKWIQVFDSVTALLFVVDCSSFDQTLREDASKNRLLDAMENFEQVWNNRFLRYVSVLLFLNKIDVLAEKVNRGKDIARLSQKYPDIFPDYDSFQPAGVEVAYFLNTCPIKNENSDQSDQRKSRLKKYSKPDVDPQTIKTAIYIKHLFMKIVSGELVLRRRLASYHKSWHDEHVCEYFYTCAIDTQNVQRVMKGCRTLLVRNHLKRYGIL